MCTKNSTADVRLYVKSYVDLLVMAPLKVWYLPRYVFLIVDSLSTINTAASDFDDHDVTKEKETGAKRMKLNVTRLTFDR